MDSMEMNHAPSQVVADLLDSKSVIHSSGVSQTREIVVTADSHSASETSFNYNLSQGVVLDRTMYLETEVTVDLTASANNLSFTANTLDEFVAAQNPVLRAMATLGIGLNNNITTVRPHLFCNALAKYSQHKNDRASFYPLSQPDHYNNRTAMTTAVDAHNSPFLSSVSGNEDTRGQHYRTYVEVQAAAAGAPQIIRFTYVFTQALDVHPYCGSPQEHEALANIRNLNVNCTWNNLNSMFLFTDNVTDGTAALTNARVSAAFTNTKAKLFIRTHAPSISIPPVVSQEYIQVLMYNYQFGTTALSSSSSVSTGSINLSQVPDRMYVYARRRANYTQADQAECFAAITNMTIRTDNDSGSLSNADQAQLWQMSARNGLEQSFKQFSRDQGSVVCVDIGKGDLGGYVSGTRVPFTFDLSVTMQNTSYSTLGASSHQFDGGAAETTDFDLYLVVVQSGVMINSSDGITTLSLGRSEQEVAELVQQGFTAPAMDNARGSGWYKAFKKGFKTGFGAVMTPAQFATGVAGLVDPRARVLSQGIGALNNTVQGAGTAVGGATRIGGKGLANLK